MRISTKSRKNRFHIDKRHVAGWLAVALSTLITCFWAFWGIIENFHEGWYYDSLLPNVGLMFLQYLSPMLIFMALALVSIQRPRIGAGLHIGAALFAVWFFNAFNNAAVFLIIVPLVGFALLYWFGRIPSTRNTTIFAVSLPLLTLIVCAVEPIYRVSTRVFDGDLSARIVQGNGVTLTWAPDGPGWPSSGTAWRDAQHICSHLTDDGLTAADDPQNIWRLPSADEAVRSMARHGVNSDGVWNESSATATYQTTPDKESPLWNIYSQVIYWWTATEIDNEHAFMIAYDGKVWRRQKNTNLDYFGFRCVK